jgi:hypothetical protein
VSNPGSLDRAHHHPRFHGWEPGERRFVDELTADPVGWVAKRLSDLDGVLDDAGVPREDVGPNDTDDVHRSAPDIVDAVRRLLDGVRAGELGQAPAGAIGSARVSWL